MNQYDSIDYELRYLSTKDNYNTNDLPDLSFDDNVHEFNEFEKDPLTDINNIFCESNNFEHYEKLYDNCIQRNNSQINTLPQNLNIIPEDNKIKNKKKLLGRKTKNSGEIGEHTKFSENNMTRKIKVLLKDSLKDHINSELKTLNLKNINIGDKTYENVNLLNIKQNQTIDTTVDGVQNFLNSKVKDIFSVPISGNYSNYPPNFNTLLIEEIYKIDDEEKVISIFEKTMLECLKYYRKDENVIDDPKYECLKGLEKDFEGLKDKLLENKDNDEKYADAVIGLIKEFETIYFNKKPRAKRVKKNQLIMDD